MTTEANGRHRSERFQMRLSAETKAGLQRKAKRADVPLNHYIATILEREADDTSRYHQQMAAKQSFMSMALLNVISARLLPTDVRKDVFRTIQEQANGLYGANPEIPDSILQGKNNDASEFVRELFELFERHAANRWEIRPE